MTTTNKVKKLILMKVPMSICNFRCHYCYIAQRPVHFEGVQPEKKYTPEQVGYALRQERIGGPAFINICADGETLLVKDLDKYVFELIKQGHFIEIVTNLTINPMLEKLLAFPREMLSHLEFKCSFHYLELIKQGKLELFAENVKKLWAAGASACIELSPSDELIPHIQDVKEFSLKHFGALPQLTILRDDRTKGRDKLTGLSEKEYSDIWSQFGSTFWEYKQSIFGVKQTNFCYAGAWSVYVDLTTGEATQCYNRTIVGNIFAEPDKPFPEKAIRKCPLTHCYNGHALLTLGLIPHSTTTTYADVRNRKKADGTNWLQPELLQFFSSQLVESNDEYSTLKKMSMTTMDNVEQFGRRGIMSLKRKVKRILGK